MDLVLLAFLLFGFTTLASAIAVISVSNPVHAALSLVLTFFSVACVWIIAGAEFLGVALILVYVGAVMVLFLFVVMMLDINVAPLREGNRRYLPDWDLHPELRATADLSQALADADLVVMGIPSHAFRATLEEAAPFVRPWIPIVSLTKGLEL
ncbi:MAG: NADH-quinone oxidoreductase subunit J, partial [Proteobacteria bacterium]|nr:NADH-quinone oxidoreductase subunit J [Pseudomonadota bacterium]